MLVELAAALTTAMSRPAFVADAPTPKRTVVFDASYSRREELTIGHFGGGGGSMPDAGAVGGSAPQVTTTSDTGTITIEVYNVVNNAVIILVTERWHSMSSPAAFKGAVEPDGSLIGFPPTISAVTRAILPLFGLHVSGDTNLSAPGAQWTDNISQPDYDIATKYAVKNVDSDVVTLTYLQTARAKSPNAMDTTLTGTLGYKPRLLVPLTGDLFERAARSDASSTDEIQTNLHFQRISDTLDRAG